MACQHQSTWPNDAKARRSSWSAFQVSVLLPEIGKNCVCFFLFPFSGGGRVSWELFWSQSIANFSFVVFSYVYMRSPKPSLPLLPQLFSSFKFKVLLHLHDPRVKFRVSLPGKTNWRLLGSMRWSFSVPTTRESWTRGVRHKVLRARTLRSWVTRTPSWLKIWASN